MILPEEEIVNVFTCKIFRLLDLLGHFPMSLRGEGATPTRLEKYPRLLFGYLQRYADPAMAFKEWESKVLRTVTQDEQNYKKNTFFPLAKETLNWLEEHPDFFQGKEKKLLIQHLRGSLYARIFAYLYPRREICLAVAHHQQNMDKEITVQKFAEIVDAAPELIRLKEIFSEEWPVIVADARENYLNAAAYYKKIIEGSLEKQKEEYLNDSTGQF